MVSYDEDGIAREVTYARHGELHRGDGPAMVIEGKHPTFLFEGETVLAPEGAAGFGKRGRTAARFADLSAATGDPGAAMDWLRAQAGGLDHLLVDSLVAAGASADLALAAARAGVNDPEVVSAVAAGALPLSWAIAGLAP